MHFYFLWLLAANRTRGNKDFYGLFFIISWGYGICHTGFGGGTENIFFFHRFFVYMPLKVPEFSVFRSNHEKWVQGAFHVVDEGDVFSSIEIPLDGTETEESLSKKGSEIAPSFVLPVLLDENRESREQSGTPSYSSFVKKEDGRIDLSAPSTAVHAQIRACSPWPKAYALLDGEPVYLTGVYGSVFSIEHDIPQEEPGTLCAFVKGKGLKLALSDGYIYITRILPPMRKEMDSASFLNGRKDATGKVLR